MFSYSSFFLLPFLILVVYGQYDTKMSPLDVLRVKHLLIDHYEGPLKYDTLKLFSNVEDLQLRNSNFIPFNTSFLLALPNLKRLLISSDVLVTIDQDITGCCEKLEELEITTSGTKDLGKVEMKMIKAMKSLKHLVLHNMRFGNLDDDNFLSPNLTHLTLKGCGLTKIRNNAFSNLQQLEMLDLEWNLLWDIKKEVLAPLKNVKTINLKGNLLEKLTTDQIPSLPNLENLKVSYNRIELLNLEGIKDVAPKLKTVDVSGSRITTAGSSDVKIINYSFGIH